MTPRPMCSGLCETACCGGACDTMPVELRGAIQQTSARIDHRVASAAREAWHGGFMVGILLGSFAGAGITLVIKAYGG